MKKLNSPCYGCTLRRTACHSNCEKYDAYRAKIETMAEKKREATKPSNDVFYARYGNPHKHKVMTNHFAQERRLKKR